MNVGVNYLREHVIPEARMHYAYLDVGGTSPNVVQDHACVHYFLRAPKSAQVQEILARVKDIAKGAALICGTECVCEIQSGMSDYIPNPTMTKLLYDSLAELGAPAFDGADRELAAKFFASFDEGSRQQVVSGLVKRYGEERAKEIVAAPLNDTVDPLDLNATPVAGSTDVGDVSYVTPTAQAMIAGFCIGTTPHTWQVTGQTGSSIGEKGYLKAGQGHRLPRGDGQGQRRAGGRDRRWLQLPRPRRRAAPHPRRGGPAGKRGGPLNRLSHRAEFLRPRRPVGALFSVQKGCLPGRGEYPSVFYR